MALHWTYQEVENPEAALMQGDILRRSEDLYHLFEKVHPYFCDPKYIAFMVITQSCDLVQRRHGQCKTDYVNLAVVRDLESCLPQFLENVCERVSQGVFVEQSKDEARRLLERILNQNEQSLGLFYLHPDADTVQISESAVAMLRVSVAVRAEHYNCLQRARTARLAVEFRNKLGWLVGNLYSRIGTPDWHEKNAKDELASLIRTMIGSSMCCWVDKGTLNEARRAGVALDDETPVDLVRTLEKYRPPPLRDVITTEVKQAATRVLSRCQDVIAQKVSSAFDSHPDDPAAVKATISAAVRKELDAASAKVANRVKNAATMRRIVSRDELT